VNRKKAVCSKGGQCDHNTTRAFLIWEITFLESSKVTFSGRHSVEHVNRNEYPLTPQGKYLKSALEVMTQLLSQPIPTSAKELHTSSSPERDSTSVTEVTSSSERVLRTTDYSPLSSRDCDASAGFLVNKIHLSPHETVQATWRRALSRAVLPPPDFVENAEEEIRLINGCPDAAPEVSPDLHPRREALISLRRLPSATITSDTENARALRESLEDFVDDADDSVMRFLREQGLLPEKRVPTWVSVQPSATSCCENASFPVSLPVSESSPRSEERRFNREYERLPLAVVWTTSQLSNAYLLIDGEAVFSRCWEVRRAKCPVNSTRHGVE